MANRYLIGSGARLWNSTSSWSATSGGASGASVPGSSDDVFMDANSGGGSLSANMLETTIKSLTMTGYTGSLLAPGAGTNRLIVTGDITIGAATSWGTSTASGAAGPALLITGACSLNTNGRTMFCGTIDIAAGALTLASDLTMSGSLTVSGGGTINGNGRNVTAAAFSSTSGSSRSISLGSGTWTVTVWSLGGAGLTFNAGTSVINVVVGASSPPFTGGGQTYNEVKFTGDGAGNITISGSNTFAIFRVAPRSSGSRSVRFTTSTTQTVTTTIDIVGTAAAIELRSTSNGSTWTISKASGTVTCDYLTIRDSIATGGATFDPGVNTTDAGNNTGWDFPTDGDGGGAIFAIL